MVSAALGCVVSSASRGSFAGGALTSPSPPVPHYRAGASSSSQALYGAETGPSANPPTYSGSHYYAPEKDRSHD